MQTLIEQKLMTINEFLRDREWPTRTSIRWYIHRNINGFADKCVLRVGKRVLIDSNKFEEWIRENAQ
ncbi:MAG: hypothetical protein S4CHLAM123_09900 [Chlamydiales bacterium]|nr:hypothetical protein [Chlamydiales bacterium]